MISLLKVAFYVLGTAACVVGLLALPVAYGEPAGLPLIMNAAVGLVYIALFGIKSAAEAAQEMIEQRRSKVFKGR